MEGKVLWVPGTCLYYAISDVTNIEIMLEVTPPRETNPIEVNGSYYVDINYQATIIRIVLDRTVNKVLLSKCQNDYLTIKENLHKYYKKLEDYRKLDHVSDILRRLFPDKSDEQILEDSNKFDEDRLTLLSTNAPILFGYCQASNFGTVTGLNIVKEYGDDMIYWDVINTSNKNATIMITSEDEALRIIPDESARLFYEHSYQSRMLNMLVQCLKND